MIDPGLCLRILAEIAIVRAAFPWLPFCGVQEGADSSFYYVYDANAQTRSIRTPPMPYTLDDATLRHVVRHELGHMWADEWGRRSGGADIYPKLSVDGSHPERHEIAAEVFARWWGHPPMQRYAHLAVLTGVTPARRSFIERSGALPDTLAERIALDQVIAAFWQRHDIPDWYRVYAANFQRWIDAYLVKR